MPGWVLLPDKLRWLGPRVTWSIATQNYGNEAHYTLPRPFSAFWPADERYKARMYYAQAFFAWAAECGLYFEEVADSPDVGIRFGFADIGAYGAWCTYRPIPGTTTFAQCMIQHSVSWLPYLGDEVIMHDLSKQSAHEIGHALGFGHATGSPAIMEFAASGLSLFPIDIEGARYLYGPPRVTDIVSQARSVISGCQNDALNLLTDESHVVLAGGGADQVATGGGGDVVVLGEGSDFATVGGGGDTVEGGGGVDQINLGAGDDSALGGPESDQIAGGEGQDIIDAGPGADWVSGGGGADMFVLHRGEVHGETIADFESGVDKLILVGFGSEPLINNGNGTYSIAGEMFIAGAINEAADVIRRDRWP